LRISDSLWNFSDTATANLETLASRFLPLFLQRDAVTKFLTTGLKKTIAFVWNKPYRDKPVATGGSLESIKDEPGSPEMMNFYTANYKIRYLPIDWQRWRLESEALGQIVEFCQQRKVPLLIVAMPLTSSNRDLLPSEFISKHQSMLERLFNNNQDSAVLLDLFASDQFNIEDYMDTVHLRSCGGMKLAKMIQAKIAKSGWLSVGRKPSLTN
jgi:hypothetical protein